MFLVLKRRPPPFTPSAYFKEDNASFQNTSTAKNADFVLKGKGLV
jgi:hypothetical protein